MFLYSFIRSRCYDLNYCKPDILLKMGKISKAIAPKITANTAIHSVWAEWSKTCQIAAPNGYFYMWESDLLMISKGGYATEYEIKLSVQDFKRDASKSGNWKDHVQLSKYESLIKGLGPNRFFYVFPKGLIDPALVPDWAGIIEISAYHYSNSINWHKASIVRNPSWLHKQKVSETLIHRISICLYYKVFNKLKKSAK